MQPGHVQPSNAQQRMRARALRHGGASLSVPLVCSHVSKRVHGSDVCNSANSNLELANEATQACAWHPRAIRPCAPTGLPAIGHTPKVPRLRAACMHGHMRRA